MMGCEECTRLERVIQDAHGVRVEARSRFEAALYVPSARELAERYRDACDEYQRRVTDLRTHRDGGCMKV